MDLPVPPPPPPPDQTSIIIPPSIIPRTPKSIHTLFWSTLALSLINLANAYKAAIALFVLNTGTSESGMLPYSTVTVMPIFLILPIMPAVFGFLLFIAAIKIKTNPRLGLKMAVIFSLLSFLSAFMLGYITAAQSSDLSAFTTNTNLEP